ncbi:MAG: 7,8-didemethyl-8-hydroxy-5-deazariboflavin synthase [Micrococcales bacterium 73-13]|nr:MAG: 7,8-didemethyl-8-hydroxy-5-deazariboflavin synthase [Micrococcales bacterium 73-13]
MNVDEVEALLGARGAELDGLLARAADLRDAGLAAAGRPGVMTYSRKVFIPLTTLCRDRCHYCTFFDTPGQLAKLGKPAYMSPEQVLAVARQGARLGCKEALLTLGDRPEARWPEARAWLDAHGYASTLDYVAATARLVLAETGLLPHLNPGVMSRTELDELRPTAPSMGMMLETTSERLWAEPGQVHHGSPDKEPALRLRVIEDAGEARIPFTTGILVGIGESLRDRAESLLAIRDAAARHGHVQETIVQNFRAKPRTAMRGADDAGFQEYLAAVATARVVLGRDARIQVPPNLSDPAEFELLVRAGADDWGGVSPLTVDHVNPERPWPQIEELERLTAAAGYRLRERLTAHPEYVLDAETWIDPGLHAAVAALAGPDGLARASGDPAAVRHPAPGDAAPAAAGASASAPSEGAPGTPPPDEDWERLLLATGDDLEELVARADDARRYTVGEVVTMVVNRNLTTSGYGGGFDLDDVAAIARDARDLGVTELCVQGLLPAGEPATGYLDVVRAARAAAPELHLHALRPQDVDDLAVRGGLGLDGALAAMREAGVDTVPGTGVKLLDDAIRARVAPDDLPVGRWEEIVRAAHAAGFSSTAVLFYGHVETAADRVAHLLRLADVQLVTGGFTELVPIPLPGWGVPLVPGRSPIDEHRAMVAVARLLLGPLVRHVQIPWPRLGADDAAALLRAGGDDLGGTLLDGRVRPEVGIEHGRELPLAEGEAIARRLLRGFRQRTTTYGVVRPAPSGDAGGGTPDHGRARPRAGAGAVGT